MVDMDARFVRRLCILDHRMRQAFPRCDIARDEECEGELPAGPIDWHESLGVLVYHIDEVGGRDIEIAVTVRAVMQLRPYQLAASLASATEAAAAGSSRCRCVITTSGVRRWMVAGWPA